MAAIDSRTSTPTPVATPTPTTTATTAATPLTAIGRSRRLLERRILWDLLIYVLLLLPVIICEFMIEPARRGFFCDDETIRYPYRNNTVNELALGLLLGLPPVCIFLLVEGVRLQRRGQLSERLSLFGLQLPLWLACWCKHMAYYCVGLLLTLDFTEVGKYTIGRLRPHFMAVCQPRLLDGSSCADERNQHRYIEQYECVATGGYLPADLRQARLSFPSGHSSLTFFAMVYLALYLQRTFTWRGSRLTRHTLQFVLFSLAWFTALSRIMDNMHHWSDVLVGSLIGVAGACLTAKWIAKLFRHSTADNALSDLKMGLKRQDTSATLQEVIANTPPPYHSSESVEYVTKI